METRATKNGTIYCEEHKVWLCCSYSAFHAVFVISFLLRAPLFFEADRSSISLLFSFLRSPAQTLTAIHFQLSFDPLPSGPSKEIAGMQFFCSHILSPSSYLHRNKPLPPKSSDTQPKLEPELKAELKPKPMAKPNPPTIATDIRPSRFHELLDPNSPSLSHLPSYDPQSSTHPFNPKPAPPKHDHKTLSPIKRLFKPKPKPKPKSKVQSPSPAPKTPNFQRAPSPKRLPLESSDSHRLRTARLELASKLQAQNPKAPFLGRVDPKTGQVKTAGQGFVGTGKAGIRDPEGDRVGDWRNWYVKPRLRGEGEGKAIREEDEVDGAA